MKGQNENPNPHLLFAAFFISQAFRIWMLVRWVSAGKVKIKLRITLGMFFLINMVVTALEIKEQG